MLMPSRLGVGLAVVISACCVASSAAAVEPAEAVSMVVDLVSRDDPGFRAIGLDRIRHGLQGEAATLAVAALVAQAPPARQIELLGALADRGDKAAVPAIAAALVATQDPGVRAQAVRALGAVGGSAEVGLLAKSLAATDPEKAAARRALVDLRGADVAGQLVGLAKSGDDGLRTTFIDILAERRERSAVPELIAIARAADAGPRAAALRALAKLAGPTDVDGLVLALLEAPPGVVRDEAIKAVVAICTSGSGSDRAAEKFVAAFKAGGDTDREVLLPALGRIGGPGALDVVDGLIADTDPARRKFGLSALSRWPDATVAPRLLDLIAKTQDFAERDLLLGALIRIAPLPDNKLDDRQKLDLLQKAMGLCQKPEDRARVLERANAIRTVEAFRFVLPYLDDPALAEPACLSVVELAHHQKLRDAHKPEFAKALDKVIATTKNPELVERANRYKEGKTWDRAKKS